MSDVSISNETESLSTLSLAGPKSGALTEALTGVKEGEWRFLDAKEVRRDLKNKTKLLL